ncbi:hypothetical protein [Absidia glauca]|uniref:Uncharacterized protein n=1 Tax=Absidia glauca TaxID=4829 RepID=A0A168Q898_ABSGL|nr:hypothetical protein [Absidia glauca]
MKSPQSAGSSEKHNDSSLVNVFPSSQESSTDISSAARRAKTINVVEALTHPLPGSTPPRPEDEPPTINCTLTHLISNETCRLVTESADENKSGYYFRPITTDSVSKISQAEAKQQDQQQQPQQIIRYDRSELEEMKRSHRSQPKKRYSRSEMEEVDHSHLSQSENVVDALTQRIPSTHLHLLNGGSNSTTSHQHPGSYQHPGSRRQPSRNSTAKQKHRERGPTYNKSETALEDDSLVASISANNDILPPSPSSTHSPIAPSLRTPPRPTSPPTSSSSTLLPTDSLPMTPPLHGYQSSPTEPSATTKEPLCAHPSYTRYSKTSFYRPSPRTIIGGRYHRK